MAATRSRVYHRKPAQDSALKQFGGIPVEFFYLRGSLSSGPIFSSVKSRVNIANIQTINTGTPGYFAPDAIESANFQAANEARHDSVNIAESYPLSLVALVRPRDATGPHIICTLLDSSSETKRIHIALRGDLSGDPVECFHHTYSGSNSLQPQTTGALTVDGWHTVAGVFTKSGSTTTATVKVVYPDGSYEEVSASNTGVGSMAGHDRLAIGRISKPTPFNTGNLDIAYVGVWREELTIQNLVNMHHNPGFMQPSPLPLRVFSTSTVQANISPRAQTFDRASAVPYEDYPDQKELNRHNAVVLTQALEGGLRSVGTATLTANATSTVVTERRTGTSSVILLSPMTANAADMTSIWFSAIGTESNGVSSFTINHDSDAATDRTYRYFVVGSGGGGFR